MSEQYLPLCTCNAHVDVENISGLYVIECLNCGNKIIDNTRSLCIQKWSELVSDGKVVESTEDWPEHISGEDLDA